MSAMASQITGVSIVYSTICSGADKKNIKAPCHWPLWGRGIHRWPVNSPHKGPVTRKMFPFDDVIMKMRRPHDKEGLLYGEIAVWCQRGWDTLYGRIANVWAMTDNRDFPWRQPAAPQVVVMTTRGGIWQLLILSNIMSVILYGTLHPKVKRMSLNTLGPRQIAAISQTTFWCAFSWMKMYKFRFKFHFHWN